MYNRLFNVPGLLLLGLFCFLTSQSFGQTRRLFDIPVRINMGSEFVIDSHGRIWLGDFGVNNDLLRIRPNDIGGGNTAPGWSLGVMVPESFSQWGYDPNHPVDRDIFNSIRWDDASDDARFDIEIPVPNSEFYVVNLYFNEACCLNRHFKIEIQGTVVEEDQFSAEFGVLIKKSYPAVVRDNLLRISLLPCADCPGVGDVNPIINALEVVIGNECDNLGMDVNSTFNFARASAEITWKSIPEAKGYIIFRNFKRWSGDLGPEVTSFTDPFPEVGENGLVVYELVASTEGFPKACQTSLSPEICAEQLSCTPQNDSKEVFLTWNRSVGKGVTAYEIRRDGELIDTVNAQTKEFIDQPGKRITNYSVTPISEVAGVCPVMTCRVCIETFEFDLPLRLNLGGPDVEDSHGSFWMGDHSTPGDDLCIRPDDLGGTNTIPNWCPPKEGGLERVGFDSNHPGDVALLTTIRWDVGNDGRDYRLELPIPNGDKYSVNLFFHECCCPGRHFKIEIEGEIVEPDVHAELYDDDPFVAGTTGKYSFEGLSVNDGALSIGILPCPECDATPHNLDQNGILSAIEVIDAAPPGSPFRRGDVNSDGTVDVSDPITNLQYQFLGTFTPGCLDAADFDDSGEIEITDPISNLSHQFLGQAPPPEPGKEACGWDPTEDELGCELAQICE